MDSWCIRGQRVVLREKVPEDAWNEYLWRTDRELARLDAAAPLTVPFPEFLKMYKEELRDPSPWSRRLSIDTTEGRHIGNCMYYDIDTRRRECEVGIMIGDRAYWGLGYGSNAVTILSRHVFLYTPLDRLYLHTLDWNERARRAFRKCGFQDRRTVRRNGKSFVLMELTRDRWEEWSYSA